MSKPVKQSRVQRRFGTKSKAFRYVRSKGGATVAVKSRFYHGWMHPKNKAKLAARNDQM